MSEITQTGGYLDVVDATLRAPRLEATSNIGISNTNPEHSFSVGSNLYVDTESSNVITVRGNVVTQGVKVGTIEIVPSYDLAAVSNVGNVTANTIIFTNETQGFVATGNATIGSTLTISGFRITAAAAAEDDLEAITTSTQDKPNAGDTTNAIRVRNGTESTSFDTGALQVGTNTGANGGLGVAGNVHVAQGVYTQDLSVSGDVVSNLAVNTNTLFVDSVNNKVGIGVTTPTAALDVVGNVAVDTNTLFVDSVNNKVGIGVTEPGATLEVTGNAYVSSNLEVGTANLFVDTVNSRVGIGTDSPSTRLQVNGDSAGTLGDIAYFRDSTGQARVVIRDEQSSPYIPPGLWTGSGGGLAIGSQFDAIKFYSTANGDTPVERMRIVGSDGNVGIGTTNPGCDLDIAGEAVCIRGDYPALYFSENDFAGSAFRIRYDGASMNDNNNYLAIQSGTNFATTCFHATLDGKVGIRTNSPNHPLSVFGNAGSVGGSANRTWFQPDSTTALSYDSSSSSGNVGVYAEDYFMSSTGFLAQNGTSSGSDYRIKKDIVDADDLVALETLRLLKPKRYKYKDEKGRGTVPVWGFIAQEVAETLPYSITLTKEFIPNIYEMANVSDSNVITFTNFNTSNLESNASTIRSYGKDDAMRLLKITEVIDEHSVRVDQDLSEWTGSFDESGNVVSGNQLFVYGEEIDDFHFLKKDAIWTVATSALQEVDRQLQAEKAKVTTLETQLTSVLARLDALESA